MFAVWFELQYREGVRVSGYATKRRRGTRFGWVVSPFESQARTWKTYSGAQRWMLETIGRLRSRASVQTIAGIIKEIEE